METHGIGVFFFFVLLFIVKNEASEYRGWLPFCDERAKEVFESIELHGDPILGINREEIFNMTFKHTLQSQNAKLLRREKDLELKLKKTTKSNKSFKLMLFGDSIVERWTRRENEHSLVQQLGLNSRNDVLVNGLRGDDTSHALNRLSRQDLDIRIESVVVLIGTNDLKYPSKFELKRGKNACLGSEALIANQRDVPKIVARILTIIDLFKVKLPNSPSPVILILGILPRGLQNRLALNNIYSRSFQGQYALPNVFTSPIEAINNALKQQVEGGFLGDDIHYKNCSDVFIERVKKGIKIKRSLMQDALHPTSEGYKVLGKCIKEGLTLMNSKK